MNNLFAAASAGLLALFGGFGLHHDGTTTAHNFTFTGSTTTHHEINDERHASSTKPYIDIACVGTAVAARESLLDGAVTTYTSAINTAYTNRASALAAAYGSTGTSTIKTGVKTAWTAFTGTMRAAKKGWQSSRETAWQTFRTAAKACGPGASSVSDLSNMGAEMSGQ